jgi:hypothetical protein
VSTDRAPETPRTDATVQPYRPTYDVAPHYQMPLSYETPASGPVHLYAERPAIVWEPDAYGRMVPMPKDRASAPLQRPEPRDLSPQPLIDPRAQYLAAGGVFAAGTGWGVGQALNALAGLGTGALMWLAIAIIAMKLAPAVGRSTTVTNHTHVTYNNRWFGKSNTTINN